MIRVAVAFVPLNYCSFREEVGRLKYSKTTLFFREVNSFISMFKFCTK